MMIRTAFTVGLLALAACNQPAAKGAAPARAPAVVTPTAAPAPAAAAPVLTTAGLGPMRIGMTDAEARAAVGAANIEADTGTEISDSCTEIKLKGAYPGVYLMINDGRLSRITLSEGAKIKTDKGVGVGARPAEVMAAYPNAQAEPHHYENPPAQYLTVWTKPEKEGVRFEVNYAGIVADIHAGDETIQYVEGCA